MPTHHPYDSEARARTLLLVDDVPATLRFYRAGLKGLLGWRLLWAESGAQALGTLRREAVDLLVTSIRMPVLGASRLIAIIQQFFPALPILALTSLVEGELRGQIPALGNLSIVPTPLRLSALMGEIQRVNQRVVVGVITGFTLPNILQLMALEHRTCTLSVKGRASFGQLYMRNGRLIHALCDRLEGMAAIYPILTWEHPRIEFVETCRVLPTITLPLEEILMHAARCRDLVQATGGRKDPWDYELT